MTAPIATRASATVRILLVDDNKSGLAARRSVLEELDYEIVTSDNPEEALVLFSKSPFDIAVVDYRMPRMNGIEFIQRARKASPEVALILLSGFADAMGLDEENTGADAVIQKSANEVSHLLRGIGRLLRRKVLKKPPANHAVGQPARRKGLR